MIDRETPMQERSSRIACEVPCTLQLGGATLSVILTDFHDRGFLISCDRRLMVGSRVGLAIPNCLPVSATVRWALGNSAGCVFERPVRAELIAAAVKAATP